MNILCLDGGGSKGIYTIGILKELEAALKSPLHEVFKLIYGTSTGSIIAALIGLGHNADEIASLYYKLIPKIMSEPCASYRSFALKTELEIFFGNRQFDEFKTNVSIVATNYDTERPLIFKSDVNQAYALKGTFQPGFGCKISDAILASSAAYPIFEKVNIKTQNRGEMVAIDGGFIANNPLFFAITDVTQSLGLNLEDVRFLSLGTGNFPEYRSLRDKIFHRIKLVQLFEKILKANANTTEILTNLLFPNLQHVRISDTYNQPEYGTSMVEANSEKLKILYRLGQESFAKKEQNVKALLSLP